MSIAGLIADLDQLGIRLEAHGDRLRYSPRTVVTPDLADQIKARKGELLTLLRTDCDQDQPIDDPWESAIEPPEPCADCGSLELWWNPLGVARCRRCKPPTTVRRLRGARPKTDADRTR